MKLMRETKENGDRAYSCSMFELRGSYSQRLKKGDKVVDWPWLIQMLLLVM